jgi:thiamine biosynthesis lipoprotein
MDHPVKPHTAFPRTCLGFMALLVCFFLCGCFPKGPEQTRTHRINRPMMGTLVEVVWRSAKAEDGSEAVRTILDRMEALSSRMSLYDPASEVVEINKAAGRRPVKVSHELLDLIEKALSLSRRTGGAFDVTVGSVEAAWGDIQREGGGRLPGEQSLREALDRVGYERVRVDRERMTVFLEQDEMRLDLGGIAKGYLVDRAMAWLEESGIPNALVNAGGDIRVSGTAESPPWRVGLQDPFEGGRLLGALSVERGAVVTSGTYERYFEREGKRFHHIMDPATGRPVEGLASVTVVAEEAFLADALATAVMVKGRQEGISMLGLFPGARSVLVERDGTIWIAEALKEALELGLLPSGNALRFYGAPGSSLPGSRRWA